MINGSGVALPRLMLALEEREVSYCGNIMLVELAIGDAYGAGFEYARPAFVRENNNLKKYYQHQKHDIKPGNYTDDTQMTIAIAELIAEASFWSPTDIAEKFVQVFKRDERVGYAGGFYNLLREVNSGNELIARLKGKNHSDKSGAAMRALPLGCLHDLNVVLWQSEVQAKITHDTPDGIHAAQAAALMSFYFLHNVGPRKELGKWISRHVPGSWAIPYEDVVGAQGWMSVRAAITTVQKCSSLSDILKMSIAFTGDVDTVATLAMGTGACCASDPKSFAEDMIHDIPEVLIEGLEDGKYGRSFLEKLEKELLFTVDIPFNRQR